MPFEVKAIETKLESRTTDQETHTVDRVSGEIQAFYEHAVGLGGKVIAGHTLSTPTYLETGSETLFLVAELPAESS